MRLLTRFEPGTVRNTEVIADRKSETSGQMVIIHCFLNNFVNNVDIEPWSRLTSLRHHMTSERRVFECVDAKEATW